MSKKISKKGVSFIFSLQGVFSLPLFFAYAFQLHSTIMPLRKEMKSISLLFSLFLVCLNSYASYDLEEYKTNKSIQRHKVPVKPEVRPSVFQKELIPLEDYLNSLRTEKDYYTLYILYIAHDESIIHFHVEDGGILRLEPVEGCKDCEQAEIEKQCKGCTESNEVYIVGLECEFKDERKEIRLYREGTLLDFVKQTISEFEELQKRKQNPE